MPRPPYGICLPVAVEHVQDGDTVYVRVRELAGGGAGLKLWHVRLLDCWAPEVTGAQKEHGKLAKQYLEKLLRGGKDVALFVPLRGDDNLLDAITSLGRVMGRLFVGHVDVGEMMVGAGWAGRTKQDLAELLRDGFKHQPF